MSTKFLKTPFIRVGVNYFKVIEKRDRFGTKQTELKSWNKQEIIEDYDRKYIKEIQKFDDFTIEPDNVRFKSKIGLFYNMYSKFPHKPKEGGWIWTERLLQHIFGDQYDIGLVYMQCLYLYPKQTLPVLGIISKERQTGKSTFIDWINILFGNNAIIINPDEIGHSFNSHYATKNIVCIEETLIEKSASVEKIKSISTQKFMTVNMKHVSHFKVPFFGKIIMASNNEDKFIKVDQEEIRFLVRKIGVPKFTNHNILNDMTKEIPAFLSHLKTLPEPDFKLSRMVFTPEQLENGTLLKVKEESKSGLYVEVLEHFEDYFNNTEKGKNEVKFTVKDVNNAFFKDKKQPFSYLKHVFLGDFGLKLGGKKERYNTILNENKVAKCFKLTRFEVTGENECIDIEDVRDVPF